MTAVRIRFSNSPPCTDMTPRSRRAFRASFSRNVPPSEDQRAQGMPGARCARSLACKMKKAYERSHHGHTGNHPAFPAQWFYGLLRALPGDQACLTPSPALLLADLTPTLGRRNDTTSPYASAPFVKGAAASTASRPALMTLRNAPLWDGTARISELIWVRWQAKFLKFRN
jgi:hypothetical protein